MNGLSGTSQGTTGTSRVVPAEISKLKKDNDIQQFVAHTPNGEQYLRDYLETNKGAENYRVISDWVISNSNNSPEGMVFGKSTRYPNMMSTPWFTKPSGQ